MLSLACVDTNARREGVGFQKIGNALAFAATGYNRPCPAFSGEAIRGKDREQTGTRPAVTALVEALLPPLEGCPAYLDPRSIVAIRAPLIFAAARGRL